ncbi:MAG: hypothetical protein O2992_04060 [Gemmatimonadetes bacterium]|jgi:hypothetical protein|nr:hypothetical protein [Gemmatimonadota bacterium]
MEHLNAEKLAQLVDNVPEPAEAAHLTACEVCTTELAALRAQTDALGALPDLMPPLGDWHVIEARLRSEGLLAHQGRFQKLGLAQTPEWMKIAAAILLFLGGTGTGMTLASTGGPQELGDLALMSDATMFASSQTIDDAASTVRVAEQNYVSALARYRELLLNESGVERGVDPLSRYAALEHLAAVSQAAVRQAPGDPYLNGLLASVLGEREATARMVSSRNNWF